MHHLVIGRSFRALPAAAVIPGCVCTGHGHHGGSPGEEQLIIAAEEHVLHGAAQKLPNQIVQVLLLQPTNQQLSATHYTFPLSLISV